MTLDELTFDELAALSLMNNCFTVQNNLDGGKEVSEEKIHMAVDFCQRTMEFKVYDDFQFMYWQHLYEELIGMNGAFPISKRLHESIRALQKRGVVLRNQQKKIMIALKEVDERNRWVGGFKTHSGVYMFGLEILQREDSEGAEIVVGHIEDKFGVSRFKGRFSQSEVEFGKHYHPILSIPGSARTVINYRGSRQQEEPFFRGRYIFMVGGEIPREGDFVLAANNDNLPSSQDLGWI